MDTPQTHYRVCNLCEAMCGLEIKHANGQVLSIAGDKKDPFSRGHICPKAVALKDIYQDPNRLKKPVKRTADGWQEISWQQAYAEVTTNLRAVQARHGHNAVAVYNGNPSVHNSGTMLTSTGLWKVLRTQNMFSATSTDQLPHHFAAWQLYGHPLLMPVPDIDHTDFMLIIGANPIASNGSIMTAPDVANRLAAIQKRGGKVVVIDPRRTETAAKADTHHFIRPGTDVFLLLAMVQTLFAENLVELAHLKDTLTGVDELRELTSAFLPEAVAVQTGISADDIRQLTRDFARAPSAVCYGRVGVSTQAFGGACLWLVNVLNALTGNLDQRGGYMLTKPAIDFMATAKVPYQRYDRFRSRVRNLPEVMGELPVSCLAEEILTPGEGQVRALITSCGNPVLSTPNGRQLDDALEALDFMVCIDIYINETSRHAHIILPPATGLEVAHYDLTFHTLAVRNTAKYSQPLFEKADGAKFDWEIFQDLQARLSDPDFDESTAVAPQNPEQKIEMGLRYGPYKLALTDLKENPHGIDLGPLEPCLPERLLTVDKKINLAPALMVKDLDRVAHALRTSTLTSEFPTLLVGRRHLRDNNSWMHNSERLVKGRNRCTLQLHPDDATRLGIDTGDTVRVASRVGAIDVPAEVTDTIMRGVACMPHGYGHNRPGVRLDVAQAHAGVSINDLTDELFLDDLTGNAALCGVPVRVESKR